MAITSAFTVDVLEVSDLPRAALAEPQLLVVRYDRRVPEQLDHVW
ncbi:MAG: hypothetical protein R3B09_06630 [Nannocystaceae bacterium]